MFHPRTKEDCAVATCEHKSLYMHIHYIQHVQVQYKTAQRQKDTRHSSMPNENKMAECVRCPEGDKLCKDTKVTGAREKKQNCCESGSLIVVTCG